MVTRRMWVEVALSTDKSDFESFEGDDRENVESKLKEPAKVTYADVNRYSIMEAV